jgi:hypothetical protein
MGMVFLGEDPELGRKVAIKMPRGTSLAHARQRFLREARAAAAVQAHEHVCQIHDVGEWEGTPFVVMAYVEGESLAQRLKREGRYADARDAVALAAQVAEGLEAVHDADIVHRDLKPGNILLDTKGKAFVTDFGLARLEDVRDGLTPEGAITPGTPDYMAPEQVDSKSFGDVTFRTDLYSLGVVLYEMLTGRRPFEGCLLNLLYEIVHGTPPTPEALRPNLDPALAVLVRRAMARRPEDRFAGAGEMARALRNWLTGRHTSVGQAEEPVIWFACKKCSKVHGRPRSLAGTLVFCECSFGNRVPWASTAEAPEVPVVEAAPPPRPARAREPLPPANVFAPKALPARPAPKVFFDRRDAGDRLRPPAVLLIVVGVLNLLFGLVPLGKGVYDLFQRELAVGWCCVGLGIADGLASVVIFLAGVRMLALRSYRLAVTGSILAVIPFVSLSSCLLLGAGVGIWALVVLMDGRVRSEFRRGGRV